MQLLDNVAECEITFALWDLLICHRITKTLLGEIYEITNLISRVKLTPLHSMSSNSEFTTMMKNNCAGGEQFQSLGAYSFLRIIESLQQKDSYLSF